MSRFKITCPSKKLLHSFRDAQGIFAIKRYCGTVFPRNNPPMLYSKSGTRTTGRARQITTRAPAPASAYQAKRPNSLITSRIQGQI
jgi:hypothetical protein